MRPTLLSLLRGQDGRRLATVLAVALAFAGFLGAIHAGVAAGAEGDGFALCQIVDPDGTSGPTVPGADHPPDCCLAGHASAYGVVPPAFVALPADFPIANTARLRWATERVAIPIFLVSKGPRGPPLDG